MAEGQAVQDLRPFMEAFLQAARAQAQVPAAAPGGWGAPQQPQAQAALPPIQGVAVALKVETPGGRARVYLSLPAEVAASYDSLMGALKALHDAGLPLDLWQDRNSWGRGGGYQGGYRGGFQGRNGYQHGDWGRRGW